MTKDVSTLLFFLLFSVFLAFVKKIFFINSFFGVL